eukprot:m.257407 g.257407  ORF g.257407 m.257407 type:complete len:398 (-) comp35275_c0_seq1:257-1450(-)
MGRKKKKIVTNIFCWYCDREFDNEDTLIQHQKARHFKCPFCSKRLYTAPGMVIHCNQVHKEEIKEVPNSLPGREDVSIEIFGMAGVDASKGPNAGKTPAATPAEVTPDEQTQPVVDPAAQQVLPPPAAPPPGTQPQYGAPPYQQPGQPQYSGGYGAPPQHHQQWGAPPQHQMYGGGRPPYGGYDQWGSRGGPPPQRGPPPRGPPPRGPPLTGASHGPPPTGGPPRGPPPSGPPGAPPGRSGPPRPPPPGASVSHTMGAPPGRPPSASVGLLQAPHMGGGPPRPPPSHMGGGQRGPPPGGPPRPPPHLGQQPPHGLPPSGPPQSNDPLPPSGWTIDASANQTSTPDANTKPPPAVAPAVASNSRLVHPQDTNMSIEEVRASLAKYRPGVRAEGAFVRY